MGERCDDCGARHRAAPAAASTSQRRLVAQGQRRCSDRRAPGTAARPVVRRAADEDICHQGSSGGVVTARLSLRWRTVPSRPPLSLGQVPAMLSGWEPLAARAKRTERSAADRSTTWWRSTAPCARYARGPAATPWSACPATSRACGWPSVATAVARTGRLAAEIFCGWSAQPRATARAPAVWASTRRAVPDARPGTRLARGPGPETRHLVVRNEPTPTTTTTTARCGPPRRRAVALSLRPGRACRSLGWHAWLSASPVHTCLHPYRLQRPGLGEGLGQ